MDKGTHVYNSQTFDARVAAGRAILSAAEDQFKPYDDQLVEALAAWLAENVMRYRWDGIYQETRASERGFPAWKVGGHANAGREDYRDVIRHIIEGARR